MGDEDIEIRRRLGRGTPAASFDDNTLTVRFRWDHADATLVIDGDAQ